MEKTTQQIHAPQNKTFSSFNAQDFLILALSLCIIIASFFNAFLLNPCQ